MLVELDVILNLINSTITGYEASSNGFELSDTTRAKRYALKMLRKKINKLKESEVG